MDERTPTTKDPLRGSLSAPYVTLTGRAVTATACTVQLGRYKARAFAGYHSSEGSPVSRGGCRRWGSWGPRGGGGCIFHYPVMVFIRAGGGWGGRNECIFFPILRPLWLRVKI